MTYTHDDAMRDLETLTPRHYTCEDCWYSCPASGECCNDLYDDDTTTCTCGADRKTASFDRLAAHIERLEHDIGGLFIEKESLKAENERLVAFGGGCVAKGGQLIEKYDALVEAAERRTGGCCDNWLKKDACTNCPNEGLCAALDALKEEK